MNYIDSISQLHKMAGLRPSAHPLFSIVRIENLHLDPAFLRARASYGFYTAGLKKNLTGYVKYGRTSYDFQEGVLGFTAPGQTLELGEELLHNASGWILCFHEALLYGSALEQDVPKYGFFGYGVNEGLHLSDTEENSLELIFQNIDKEYHLPIDKFSKRIVLSNLELLLNYAQRFYARQFIIRHEVDDSLFQRFSRLLQDYINNKDNLPTVSGLAEQLHLSPSYLSDYLKQITGKSALDHIHDFLIQRAKHELLESEQSIAEIAFGLGFQYPQYFSRLFKKRTGLTPTAYRLRRGVG